MLWQQLLRVALDRLQDTAENPPPFRLGKHLVTRAETFEGRTSDAIVRFGSTRPNERCEPIGVIWREVD